MKKVKVSKSNRMVSTSHQRHGTINPFPYSWSMSTHQAERIQKSMYQKLRGGVKLLIRLTTEEQPPVKVMMMME